ncbi:MAG: helix-turn-helix transcriptional regulator [Ruminococcaceae bacterium]|nr:helix-turn-helix transcriptional regulator [Oscillospiraceae bacterium]
MEVEYELTNRGNEGFPFEYYYLNGDHPRYVMPYHWHMDYEIVHVIKGILPIHVGNKFIEMTDGDSVLVPPGAIHGSLPPTGEYECVVFDVTRMFLLGSPSQNALISFWDMRNGDPVIISKNSEQNRRVEEFFSAMRENEKPLFGRVLRAAGALLSVYGDFYEELANIPGAQKDKSVRVKRVISFIRENYTSHITLNDLSLAVGLNREYLCREFKTVMGMSPIAFLIEYRLEQSKKILLSPSGSVTEAALSSGFSDISYYIKKFTALNGCTPLQFRRARSKNAEGV